MSKIQNSKLRNMFNMKISNSELKDLNSNFCKSVLKVINEKHDSYITRALYENNLKRITKALKQNRSGYSNKKDNKTNNLIEIVASSSIKSKHLIRILNKIANKNSKPKNAARILNKIACNKFKKAAYTLNQMAFDNLKNAVNTLNEIANLNLKNAAAILNEIADNQLKNAAVILNEIEEIDIEFLKSYVNKLNGTSDPLESDKKNIFILSSDIDETVCAITHIPLVSTDPSEETVIDTVFIKNSNNLINSHVYDRKSIYTSFEVNGLSNPATRERVYLSDVRNLFIIKVENDEHSYEHS